jgi:hypothetical protein
MAIWGVSRQTRANLKVDPTGARPFRPHPCPLPQSPGYCSPHVLWWERGHARRVADSPPIGFTNGPEVSGVSQPQIEFAEVAPSRGIRG